MKNIFPDLLVYAGIYTGNDEESLLLQEFEKDKDVSGTYDFPRLSSGYLYSDELMWDIYNGIAHYGIVNHFIHPDDLLDPERSQGTKWKDLDKNIFLLELPQITFNKRVQQIISLELPV